ncbi:unnamed protein product [Rotaria magnacalcarata]|uniref:Uncharacterized protein n=1 Tax=Rotaria magnacalcarata TaxID=392030 RepID=A0A814PZV2_9BILA|nr:unnamed protein product [Rotaria magnacalcarata]CAF1576607.1 unnamed protein product [Rotaria magnacalcarata]CAF2233317.1 unnamed protein product [Rotaria magnacalcarata]CAF3907044.1 unnamed protein product [Rotaria magnacalcarata]CAF3961106.1 unnamed protein product [Rotaria magnacalcarata]
MDYFELDEALELAKLQYEIRLKRKRENSSRSHSCVENVHTTYPQYTSLSTDSRLFADYLPGTFQQFESNGIGAEDISSNINFVQDMQKPDDTDAVNITSASDANNESDESDNLVDIDPPLHQYTDTLTNTYCYRIIKAFRSAQLSKTNSNLLLNLILSALPSPNNLPVNTKKLLQKLELDNNFFRETKICLLCYQEISSSNRVCYYCPTSNENDIALIYDSDIKLILYLLLQKLGDVIRTYKEKLILNNDTSGTFDIGFAYAYQSLLRQFQNENFITVLMHLDGVGLCKSNKLKMWLLSFSIVELPAKLRYERHNMAAVSIWVSSKEPIASLWLHKSMKTIKELKSTGVVINDQIIKLKVLAITGDSPALKIALNFIGHNGYYCCYFCYLEGIHQNGKRQYPFECLHQMRTIDTFARDAATAARLNRNEYGHLGVSIFAGILDLALPLSIVVDYAHVTLLRHSKSIFKEFYRRLTPSVRNDVDRALIQQPFPHFFNRKMKPFNDLAFVKATEIRNILFDGILPIFHKHLPVDIVGHFAMFISAMRLLHGKPVLGGETSKLAGDLLTRYYKDFDIFYEGLQNFVLHLHHHFKNQYEMYGAFSHLGSFGQEALIGYVGSNKTGTRFYGPLICQNYSIDFLLHHKMQKLSQPDQVVDGPFDCNFKFDFKSNSIFELLHNSHCICTSINTCLFAYRRCIINAQVYHSLEYNQRQRSVSYFIRYSSTTEPNSYLFGKIMVFFKCSNSNYAMIQRYPVVGQFSDLFRSSSYYEILDRSINHFFFIISRQGVLPYETVLISRIVDHCIIFDCQNYYVATPVSSYDEHD